MGRDKSAPIAALRQAKIYLACKLRLPQLVFAATIREPQPASLAYILVDCGSSWIAAIAYIWPQSASSWNAAGQRVDCGSSWIAAAAIHNDAAQ